MKKLLIMLISFVILPTLVSSGLTNELRGHVTDRVTATVIAGAKVQLMKSGQATNYQTATDFEGNFSIVNIPPDSYDVVIFHPNYETKEIKNIKITDGIVTGFSYGYLAMEPIKILPNENVAFRQLKKTMPLNQGDILLGPFPLSSGFYFDSTQSSQYKRGRQVRGQVLEKKTKEPVIGARIHLFLYDGTSTKLSAITDIKGNFLILNLPPGTYQLEISYGPSFVKQLIKNVKVEDDRIFETGIIYMEEKAVEGDTLILPSGNRSY
ncbi:MAG TPA: carboxypeptidase regulatory-like domain-containing protein [Verrucomicrobiae bacterium]|nr:carboxypeptidase regulatory-like domain-containing protein [Verrucomicrobiae bacterium]